VGITASLTNVAAGYPVRLTALIEGRTAASVWQFRDRLMENNRPYATHAWTAPGDYAVVLRAYNESEASGVSATVTVHVVTLPIHYVAADSVNSAAPYSSWATAATSIQDAVDAATVPGALVLVTNGTYATGGRGVVDAFNEVTTNRVTVDKPLTLRSVNGPQFTIIKGAGEATPVRCVYLIGGASLSGFTLTNGVARNGGGVWCESAAAVVSNCVVAGNSAPRSGGLGGGVYGGTLNNCTLTANSAGNDFVSGGGGACFSTLNYCTLVDNVAKYGNGGGASDCTLNNCTLVGNLADNVGGGAFGCTLSNCTLSGNSAAKGGGFFGGFGHTLNNCIVYHNTAREDANFNVNGGSMLSYCCTTPQPTDGFGNITNTPLFLNQAGGNLRLQSNSPCINAGNNTYLVGSTDLDGSPRIVGGTVDIGAYEFQNPASLISYAWLQQYALPIDGSGDTTDPDADALNNWQEWRCGTDPTNSLSVLRLLSPVRAGADIIVRWQSVGGRSYFLEHGTNWGSSQAFTPLIANIPGLPGISTYRDSNAAGAGSVFYRVGVNSP